MKKSPSCKVGECFGHSWAENSPSLVWKRQDLRSIGMGVFLFCPSPGKHAAESSIPVVFQERVLQNSEMALTSLRTMFPIYFPLDVPQLDAL